MTEAVTYLENILEPLIDNPDDLRVTEKFDEMGVLLSVDLHPVDMGKVIGRGGNTIDAIRLLIRQYGLKNKARISLKINEPER